MTCQNCMPCIGSSGWASNSKERVRLGKQGPLVSWLCSFHLSLSLNAAAQAFTQNICPISSEASACGKHPSSVHVGCLSYGCIVDSSVYQSFHARCCKFGLRIFGLPISRVHLSTMLDLHSWLTVKRPPVGNIFLCPKVA